MTNLQKNNGSYPNPREELDVNVGGYFLKLKRRWIPALAVFVVTVGATTFLSGFLEKTYKSEGKLLFKKDAISFLSNIGDNNAGQIQSIRPNDTPLSTEQLRITSEPVLQETIDQLKLENEEGQPLKVKALKKKLSVDIVGGTDVISIVYKDADPVTAAKVIDLSLIHI